MLRDVLVNEVPLLLHRDLYALPALLGAMIVVVVPSRVRLECRARGGYRVRHRVALPRPGAALEPADRAGDRS